MSASILTVALHQPTTNEVVNSTSLFYRNMFGRMVKTSVSSYLYIFANRMVILVRECGDKLHGGLLVRCGNLKIVLGATLVALSAVT